MKVKLPGYWKGTTFDALSRMDMARALKRNELVQILAVSPNRHSGKLHYLYVMVRVSKNAEEVTAYYRRVLSNNLILLTNLSIIRIIIAFL